MRLHHINIAAPSSILEATKIFYCDVLGLSAGFRPNLKTPGYWLYGDSDPIVHLSVSDDIHGGSNRMNYLDHIAFADSDLEERLTLLEEHGLDYTSRKIEEEGVTQIFLHDPCGHKIELNFCESLSDD